MRRGISCPCCTEDQVTLYDAIYGNKSPINYPEFEIYKTKQVDILIMVSGAFAKGTGTERQ